MIGAAIKFWKIVGGMQPRNWKGVSQARNERKTIKIEYTLQKLWNFYMININNIRYKI